MKVELPYTKDSFDADAQTRFLSAVASSVQTPVGNLYIRSVVERTSSRRVLRKLLAVSVEVDFAIRVPDAAAQAAMIANEGLTAGRLNTELAKQVSPFCVLGMLVCVFGLLAFTALCGRASTACMRVHALCLFLHPSNRPDCACSAPLLTASASNRGSPPRWCSRSRRHRRHRRLPRSLLLVARARRGASSSRVSSACTVLRQCFADAPSVLSLFAPSQTPTRRRVPITPKCYDSCSS
jgi:hypothetical protein